ncbi:hypothetical protein [Streptomyces sp. NPDC046821]|uniref:hypothetical protein n=1 Tax=Streptomyces sp. NPDC046821 TaxID=3154702 RepID=UPI0033E1D791
MTYVSQPPASPLKVGRIGASVALLTVGVLGWARHGLPRLLARAHGGPPGTCGLVAVRPGPDVTADPGDPVAAAETELRNRVSELASDLASRIGHEAQGYGGPAHS